MLWTIALGMTVFRGAFQWRLQGRLHGDDYFVFAGLVSLTVLTAVITRLVPQFFLVGEWSKAMAKDPTTPLPLPMDEFNARNVASLKMMFCQMLLFWTTLWMGECPFLLVLPVVRSSDLCWCRDADIPQPSFRFSSSSDDS